MTREVDAPAAGKTAARDEVLALLRDGSGRRPRFDPGLSGGLRAWLEDGASAIASAHGEGAAPLYLGPRLLWGTSAAAADPASAVSADPFPPDLVTSCLIRALFRQLVTTGRLGDPLTDAVDALRVDSDRLALVRWIDGMSDARRTALADTLAPHVAHLGNLTPVSPPDGCRGPTIVSPSRSPEVVSCCPASSISSWAPRFPARPRCARSV